MPEPIREWRDVTPEIFRERIFPANEPAVIRDAVRHWPAVRAGSESPAALSNYLRGHDVGASADTMVGPPSIDGKFFYNDDMTGLNFQRGPAPLMTSLERIIGLLDDPSPPAVYVGAVPTPMVMPNFTRENSLDWLDPAIPPRLWFGNRVTVQTHYDISHNVACVIAGRRRFTLFPPEQLVNLYVGPLEFTLAGQPISMVKLHAPDHERYPRFREAWQQAVSAELAPGDAIYVPYMWWHHVESLDRFNALVNYWWDEQPSWQGSPFEALLHGLLSIRALPPERREVWRTVFDHLVFKTEGEPLEHLTPRQRGIQGTLTPQIAEVLRAHVMKALMRR